MAYFHNNRKQFRDAIDAVYEQTRVMVHVIEKDYRSLIQEDNHCLRHNGSLLVFALAFLMFQW